MEPVGAVKDFQQHVAQYIKEYDCYGNSAERDHVEFMPQIELGRFWTIEKIEDVLCSKEPHILDTGQEIREHYLVVFSVLTFMARHQDISVFIRYNVDDSGLPLLATPTAASESSSDREVFERFQKSQWKFCPLTLNMGRSERKPSKRELSPFHIIPVSKTERISPRESGRRDDICLDKVTLHEQCSTYKTVVFKVLRGSSDTLKVMYDNEVDMYKNLIKEDSFNHIMRYYGSFQSLDVRVIILEYANGGTLESFFEHQPPPQSKTERELFWNCLMGLSRGLERIHNLTDSKEYSKGAWMRRGTHQDIHPQNILVCNEGFGNMHGFAFKFADMGTGHIRRMRYKGLDEDAMDQEGNGMYNLIATVDLVWHICLADKTGLSKYLNPTPKKQRGRHPFKIFPQLAIDVNKVKGDKGRDQIFLVDDSASMKNHKEAVGRTCRVLAYVLKEGGADPDEAFDLYFTSAQPNVRSGKSSDLQKAVQECKFSDNTCDMQSSLDLIATKVIQNRKQVSIYVLTNGHWNLQSDEKFCGVDFPIRRLIRHIKKEDKQRNWVGIQFIRFFDQPFSNEDKLGRERLIRLDEELETEADRDIVDTTDFGKDVHKMLTGALSRWEDAVGEGEKDFET
ncbi:putative serine/threonine-protein kinase [Colletotrichum aenigma]|uniref:putative serine/threonine-protein kinase n=1 Tax=Colletotrichum aenigma TaxID=1215731 RepID=UPI00187257AA|nr:putative serine/threonine-protein kinase [Colletotrichum aenigma]KAF5512762.1 putative serine/threonine-protein kinase [Colletotrichum aenigma]